MERRNFIKTTSGSILGLSLGSSSAFLGNDIEGTNIEQQIRLGIDSYSLRGFPRNPFELIDYAASVEADSIEFFGITIRQNPFESLEDEYLKKVKAHADRAGVAIFPAIGIICPIPGPLLSVGYGRQAPPKEKLLLGLRMAQNLGASAIKCVLGGAGDRRDSIPLPAKMEATIKALRSVRSQAVDAGVKFAVETHGDLLARELKVIIEEAGPEYVGCCLDVGNQVMNVEDPLMTLEILGPYTVMSHIRDSVVYEHPRGAAVQWVALGDGNIDFKSFVALWRQLCPQAYFNLEIITGSPPRVLPYLEQDFWEAYPEMPAKDFARFLSLVRNGHPFTGSMMIARGEDQPPEYAAAMLQQQQFDLERSLEYAKKTLDLGVRWRKRS